MKTEKISVAEISRLREAAEIERNTHHEVMNRISKISSVQVGFNWLPDGLPAKEQMQIVKRGNQKEIMALLTAYANLRMSSHDEERVERVNVAPEVQMYIFHQPIGFDAARIYMLEHNRLCLDVETELIKKKMMSVIAKKRLSPKAEVFLLTHCLHEGKEQDSDSSLFPVQEYLEKNRLSPLGQQALMTYLNVGGGRDSFIDACRNCVKTYVERYKELSLPAQREMVKSGDSELIMSYILFSKRGLEAEEELLERGNREEVEAYFKRYATL